MSRSARRGSFWPSTIQHALLQVALGPPEQAAARWQELQPLDVTKLEPGSFGLLPLLYERLTDVAPNEPQLPRLFGTYRSIWYRNSLLRDRLAVLLPLLRQRAGVQPLLVGGMSVLLRWYPRLGLRPVPQLELIVEAEAAEVAVKVAGYSGWRPSGRGRSRTALRDESGRLLVVHHGAPPALAGPLAGDALPALLERARELESLEGTPLVLDAADELLFACAFGARTVLVKTCQWLVDANTILRLPDLVSPEDVLARARRVHLVEALRATVGYLGELTGDEIPAGYVGALDAEPATLRDRVAFTLAGVGGKRLAGTAQILASYLHATADDPLPRVVARLPYYLQDRWGADRLAAVPMLALWKTLRLLLRPVQASAPGRNRSASS